MYHTSITFPTIDYWTDDTAAFTISNTSEETSSRLRTSPESDPRSCSPDWPTPTTDKSHFQSDTAFAGPTYSMPRKSAPYKRQQVSYLPETVNTAWQALTVPVPNFDKPLCPPRRFYFEAAPCCSTPQIRIIHECCNKETKPREIVDERTPFPRRNYPVPSKLTLCRFCLKNGEPPSVYYSHNLHVEDGRVSCPVLRRYDCPICKNGGGDYAHTVRYCPTLRANFGRG